MTRNEVLKELYGTTQLKQMKDDFVKEAKKVRTLHNMAEFLSKWNYYFMYETPTTTLKGRSLELRKILINGGIKEDNPIIEFFKMPSEIYTFMNKKDNKKVEENLKKAETDNEDYWKLANNIIKKLSHHIEDKILLNTSNNSDDEKELAYLKVLLLSLATGRRQIEIMKMLEISKKKDMAEYKNLAKKKKDDKNSVVAPILIDVNIAKKYLKDIREVFQTETMTNKQVNSKFNAVVKNALKRYLPELGGEGLHYFRKIYAEACYFKFGKNAPKNKYFTDILGHEFKANSAHHYEAKK